MPKSVHKLKMFGRVGQSLGHGQKPLAKLQFWGHVKTSVSRKAQFSKVGDKTSNFFSKAKRTTNLKNGVLATGFVTFTFSRCFSPTCRQLHEMAVRGSVIKPASIKAVQPEKLGAVFFSCVGVTLRRTSSARVKMHPSWRSWNWTFLPPPKNHGPEIPTMPVMPWPIKYASKIQKYAPYCILWGRSQLLISQARNCRHVHYRSGLDCCSVPVDSRGPSEGLCTHHGKVWVTCSIGPGACASPGPHQNCGKIMHRQNLVMEVVFFSHVVGFYCRLSQ